MKWADVNEALVEGSYKMVGASWSATTCPTP